MNWYDAIWDSENGTMIFDNGHSEKLSPLDVKEGMVIVVDRESDELFSRSTPQDAILMTLEICKHAPQHTYLFVTSTPERYVKLADEEVLPTNDNFWYGSMVRSPDDVFWWSDSHNCFVYVLQLEQEFPPTGGKPIKKIDWLILDSQNDMDSEPEWYSVIAADCRAAHVPLFVTTAAAGFVSEEEFSQEFPWGAERCMRIKFQR